MRNKSGGPPSPIPSPFLFSGLIVATVGVWACGDGGILPDGDLTALCEALRPELISGAARDAIPALTDPRLVGVGDPTTNYLRGTDRVIGLEIAGEYIAVPHNILWWHEIVNFNEVGLAVTYCPLTGSSMVFDRTAAGGAELGVSGLLFRNNLVMYDRSPSGVVETLWPQMLAGGRCGPRGRSEVGHSSGPRDRVGGLGGAPSGHPGREQGHRILEDLHEVPLWEL